MWGSSQAFTPSGQSLFACGPSPEGSKTLDKVAQFSRANHQRWPAAEGCPQGHCQKLGSESSSKGTSGGHNTASNRLWYLQARDELKHKFLLLLSASSLQRASTYHASRRGEFTVQTFLSLFKLRVLLGIHIF